MPLFAEVLDTVRTSPEETAIARAILMVGALQPGGSTLATIHAINSVSILDGCRDDSFRQLVAKGRISFAWLQNDDGSLRSPREELMSRLGTERYFFAWPETRDVDGAGAPITLSDPCRYARLRLGPKSKRPALAGGPLDDRLQAADELFHAIEERAKVVPPQIEQERRGEFTAILRRAAADMPKEATYDAARAIVSELARTGPIDSKRSNAYAAIEAAAGDSEVAFQAKDVVDAAYNRAIAFSLGASLLSSRRAVSLTSGFHGDAGVLHAPIRVIEDSHLDERLRSLNTLPMTWNGIRDALATFGADLNLYDSRDARDKLSEAMAKDDWRVKRMPIISAGAAAGIGTTVTLALGVALTPMILGPLAILGVMAGVAFDSFAGEHQEKIIARKFRTTLDGWMDAHEASGDAYLRSN
jgi:hypothetical protein